MYFLIGEADIGVSGKTKVYIGEAEVLIKRLKQHDNPNKKSENFWNYAICFVSEKNNINKAHIKYLESHSFSQAKKINKCEVINSTTPTQPSLTEQDEDFMLSFFDDLKLLIATLGYPIFEESKKERGKTFICKTKGAYAMGEYTEDGFVVFRGSKARLTEVKSLSNAIRNLRWGLVEEKILRSDGEFLIFAEDFTFSSPSTAASVVLGRETNGWDAWKDEKGRSLDERLRNHIS